MGQLQGKSALVTGSTSGIGLGIADALAMAGCHLTLNGFGEPQAIDDLKASLVKKYQVKVHYSAADIRQPQQIAAMMEDASERRSRHTGQQCGDPVCRIIFTKG